MAEVMRWMSREKSVVDFETEDKGIA